MAHGIITGMKNRKKIAGAVALVAVIAAVLGGVAYATSLYLDASYSALHQGCSPRNTRHQAVIKDNKITPEHTDAQKCDTLTIKNLDDADRLMAFGVHDKHVSYGGVEEREVRSGQSFTITLTQRGSYIFHDHMDEDVAGTFQVK